MASLVNNTEIDFADPFDRLDKLVARAMEQDANTKLAWRPFRVSLMEAIAIANEGGALGGYFSMGGKQSVLLNYEGCTFMVESPILLVCLEPEGLKIKNHYIH